MAKKIYLILVLGFGLLLVGCGIRTSSEILIIGLADDLVSLDPHATNDAVSSSVGVQIYQTLIFQDENLILHPGLATSWEDVGDNTYMFHLRKNVYFHNGELFKASDVKFTLTRALDAPAISFIVGTLDKDKIVIIDDYTILIGTTEPFGPFLTHLAHPAIGILNQKAVEAAGANYGLTSAIGTGPFKFLSWISGAKITLVRNEDYYLAKANVLFVEFRIIRSSSIRVIELETRAIDIAYNISPVDIRVINADQELTLLNTPNLSVEYLGFNLRDNDILKNQLVRAAIAHLIDVDAIIETIYLNSGARLSGPINSLVFGFNDTLEPYQYDLDLAKSLLREAGYENGGFSLRLFVADSNLERLKVAQVIAQKLRMVNIICTVVELQWASFLTATANGDADLFLLGWSTITTDADYGLYPLFHSSSLPQSGNRTFFSDPEVDELLDFARHSVISNERLTAYFRVQEIIHEKLPWVFLNSGENLSAYSSRISGFVHHPSGSHLLVNVKKD